MKKVWIVLLILLLLLGIAVGVAYVLLQQPKTQSRIAQSLTKNLSDKIGLPVTVESVDIEFFNKATVNNFNIGDEFGDTLIQVKLLKANIGVFDLFGKSVDIKDVEIENAHIHITKTYSTGKYNSQNVMDKLFAKKDSSNKKKWDIDFSDVHLKNVTLHQVDSTSGSFITYYVKDFTTTATNFNADKNELAFSSTVIDGFVLKINSFEPNYQLVLDATPLEADSLKKFWKVSAEDVAIANSIIEINQNNQTPVKSNAVDLEHLAFNEINGTIKNLLVISDTVRGVINLSSVERNGFKLQELSGAYEMHNNIMALQNMKLITANSELQDYFHLEFKSMSEFSEFADKVKMDMNFSNASISPKDLKYWAPAINEIPFFTEQQNKKVKLNGRVYGSIDNLKGRNLNLYFGQTAYAGNFSMRGLPDIKETFIDFKADYINTSSREIKSLLPHVKFPKDFNKFGDIKFAGRFTGFVNDFVAEGKATTALGNFDSDINLKINPNTNYSKYNGKLAITNFNMGKWFEEENLGKATFNLQLDGKGLTLNSLDADLKGKINSLELNGYTYNNVDVDGRFKQEKFDGHFSISDPNIDLEFKGEADFTKEIPDLNFDADVIALNLKKLNLTEKEIIIKGAFDADLTGKKIDDIVGDIKVVDGVLTIEGETYEFDTLAINSSVTNDKRKLTLNSEIATGYIEGDFTPSALPNTFKQFIYPYFSQSIFYSNKPVLNNQKFETKVWIKKTEKLTQLFLPQLGNVEQAVVQGEFDYQKNYVDLKMVVPYTTFDNIGFRNFSIEVTNTAQSLNFQSFTDTLHISDSIKITDTRFSGKLNENQLEFAIATANSNAPNRIDVEGTLTNINDTLLATFSKGAFYLNNSKWETQTNSSVFYAGSVFQSDYFVISNGNQQISLVSKPDKAHTSITKLDLVDINIKQLAPLAGLSELKAKGSITGNLEIKSLNNNPIIEVDFLIPLLVFDKDTIGKIEVKGDKTANDPLLTYSGSIFGAYNDVKIDGTYNFDDDVSPIDATLIPRKIYLPSIEKFVKDFVSSLDGYANGNIKLTGSLDKPVANGSIVLQNAALKVNYLGTRYTINNQTFKLSQNKIDLTGLVIKDADGRSAFGSGFIGHNYFKDWFLNCFISSENFKFLNTNKLDNELYYGVAYARASVGFEGPLSNMIIKIDGSPKEGTVFNIPISNSKTTQQYDFIRFTNSGVKEEDEREIKKLTGVILDMTLDLNPYAKVNIILDEATRDILEARGTGNLQINVNTLGDFTMYGDYVATSGEYLFTYQDLLVNKRFQVKPGGRILWTGDPYEAQIDIEAIYNTTASIKDLLESYKKEGPGSPSSGGITRIETELFLKLSGSLLNPEVNFDFETAETATSSQIELNTIFSSIKSNRNELNKQVFGLLVMNKFLPVSSGFGTDQITSSVSATASEFLFNQISLYLTDFFSSFITEVELDINLDSYDASSTDFENAQGNELQVALSKQFFDNRVNVIVGGNFDLTSSELTQNANSSAISGDFIIEYNITEDGQLKAKAFRRSVEDLIDGNKSKSGVSLFYTVEYDRLSDLFNRNNKPKKQNNNATGMIEPEKVGIKEF